MLVPYQLAMGNFPEAGTNWILWFILFIYLLDIPFCLSQFNDASSEILLPEEYSVSNYIRFWIFLDIFCVVPFFYFTGVHSLALVQMLKLFKVSHFMRGLKSKEIQYELVLNIVFFIYWMIISVHCLSSGWMAIRNDELSVADPDRYLKSVYWVITTLSTVGYGDITPTDQSQYVYAIFIEILGVAVFGYVIGKVASYLTRKDPATVSYLSNLDKLKALVKYRGIPNALQKKLQNYYTYQWRKRLGYDERSFLAGLPENLQKEVSLHLKKELIEKISLFRKADPNFITEVAIHLKPMVLTPDDILFRKGDLGDSMYFVVSGELVALDENGAELSTFNVGDYFGEIALFDSAHKRSATIKSNTYSDLYKLENTTFQKFRQFYLDIYEEVHKKAIEREKDNIRRESRS
jgi:voltage-gated potassium channel